MGAHFFLSLLMQTEFDLNAHAGPKPGTVALLQYVADWEETRKARKEHWEKPAWRKQRFRAFVAKKKSEARFFRRMHELAGAAEGVRPLVFFGGWVMHPGLRCGPPTPGIGLARRMVDAGFDVVLVHEAMTSMNFYATGEELLDAGLTDKANSYLFILAFHLAQH